MENNIIKIYLIGSLSWWNVSKWRGTGWLALLSSLSGWESHLAAGQYIRSSVSMSSRIRAFWGGWWTNVSTACLSQVGSACQWLFRETVMQQRLQRSLWHSLQRRLQAHWIQHPSMSGKRYMVRRGSRLSDAQLWLCSGSKERKNWMHFG